MKKLITIFMLLCESVIAESVATYNGYMSTYSGLLCTYESSTVPALWTPDDLTDVKIGLDATDTNYITQAGGLVSVWRDKWGSGLVNMESIAGDTQPTTGQDTLNGLNVITFQTTDQLTNSLALSTATLSVYYVRKYTALLSLSRSWSIRRNTFTQGLLNDYYYDDEYKLGYTYPDSAFCGYEAATNTEIVTLNISPSVWGYSVNGSYVAAGTIPTPFTSELITIGSAGGAYHAYVQFATFIVTTNFSTDARQKFEGWASHKFNIALPIGHPYKSVPPEK